MPARSAHRFEQAASLRKQQKWQGSRAVGQTQRAAVCWSLLVTAWFCLSAGFGIVGYSCCLAGVHELWPATRNVARPSTAVGFAASAGGLDGDAGIGGGRWDWRDGGRGQRRADAASALARRSTRPGHGMRGTSRPGGPAAVMSTMSTTRRSAVLHATRVIRAREEQKKGEEDAEKESMGSSCDSLRLLSAPFCPPSLPCRGQSGRGRPRPATAPVGRILGTSASASSASTFSRRRPLVTRPAAVYFFRSLVRLLADSRSPSPPSPL